MHLKRAKGQAKTGLVKFASIALGLSMAGSALAESPQRVVSINVCTDQLAMLLAADGQLVSVSNLARDSTMSVLADQAQKMPINYAQAEEVFLQKPDLVLTSTFSNRDTVSMLRKLGVRVVEFKPAETYEDIFKQIANMGELLGRQPQAERMIASMRQRLAAIKRPDKPRTVALYFANSYTSGRGVLIDDAVRQAGLKNMADDIGIIGVAQLPLEQLVMEKPDMLILSGRERTPALAHENYYHPAIRQMRKTVPTVVLNDNLTVCGAPFSVDAVAGLAEAARD